VESVVSLRGISLASFDAVAVAGVLADLLGLQPAAVSATVQSFALSSSLSLAGGGASLTPAQQNAIASSVAASLPGVTAAQVALSGGAAAAHRRRRHLLQAPALQVGVTVSGLPADAVAATQAAALLTAPATLSALVASVAGSGITGATAAPVAVAAQLAIAVQVPASGSSGTVTAALSASGTTSLAAALQAAGVSTSGVTVVAAPLVAAPPPPPAPPSLPDVRGRIAGGVIGGVAGAALLVTVIALAMRRWNAVSGSTTDNTKDSSIRTDTTASPGDDGGGAWRTFLSSADEVVLGARIGKGGYAVVHDATWRGTQVAVKVFDTSLQLRLGGFTSVGGVTTSGEVGSLTSGSGASSRSYVREVALLSSLRHPNILAIYALVEAPRAMLVMELGAAGSLRDLLYRTSLQNVTWSKRVVLATGVACGVDFLHSQKPPIIHFDLKSANVVLDMALVPKARAPRAGASMPSVVRPLKLCCPPLQVCDFGISSILGQLDGQGALRGTPRYMVRAPSPRASHFLRPRADMRPIGRARLPSCFFAGARGCAAAGHHQLPRRRLLRPRLRAARPGPREHGCGHARAPRQRGPEPGRAVERRDQHLSGGLASGAHALRARAVRLRARRRAARAAAAGAAGAQLPGGRPRGAAGGGAGAHDTGAARRLGKHVVSCHTLLCSICSVPCDSECS
jgi:hypothetical protein